MLSSPPDPIYSEAEVPACELPPIGDAANTRALFAEHVYGRFPFEVPEIRVDLMEEGRGLEGRARRRQLRVRLGAGGVQVDFDILLYTPADAPEAVPMFLGLNFDGNDAGCADPEIVPPASWRASREIERGSRADRWPIGAIVAGGFGLATIYCGDFAPDDPAHVAEGVLKFFPDEGESSGGAVSAWAWGLSRALDALEFAAQPVAVIGHSRLGKAALWAGACDERFGLVISNESGCTGAALARRRYGERLIHINRSFPHWFARKYHSYNEREQDLPVDQHQLLALIAPRGLYVASALEDRWADPRGEYLALAAAAPAWGEALPAEPPAPGVPLHRGRLGYHIRPGPHELTTADWAHYLGFAGRFWARENPSACLPGR